MPVGQRDGTQAWTWSQGAGLVAVGLLAADPLSPSGATPMLRCVSAVLAVPFAQHMPIVLPSAFVLNIFVVVHSAAAAA